MLLIASLAIVFRFALLSRFNLLFGSSVDGLIETSILEHWWNVFQDITRWDQTFYFFPEKGTLGYNDGYFLYGAIYSIFRLARLDPFLSSELVDVVVRLVGFFSFAAFARGTLRAPAWMAAFGAAVFTASNNSYYQGAHAQLLSVAFAPLEGILLAGAASAMMRGDRLLAAAAGMGAALLLAAWFLTSFYMAWFFTLFCTVWLPMMAAWSGSARRRQILRSCRRCWGPLLASFAVLALGLLPTAQMYLAVLSSAGAHDFTETSQYLLQPLDALNLGAGNLLWGWLDRGWLSSLPVGGEHPTGFTPLLLAAFVAGLAAAILRCRLVPASLGVATLLCWLLALRVGDWSAWRLVYAFAPAGAAIRVVARLQLFLDWPLISVALTGLADLPALLPRRHTTGAVLAAATALLLLMEQVNTTRIPALDRSAELAVFQRTAPPPVACRVFFTPNAASPDPGFGPVIRAMVQSNVDAMMAAEWFHLPTVNGFATKLPRGWDLLYSDRLDYRARVRDYAVAHDLLPSLCELDLHNSQWNEHPFKD